MLANKKACDIGLPTHVTCHEMYLQTTYTTERDRLMHSCIANHVRQFMLREPVVESLSDCHWIDGDDLMSLWNDLHKHGYCDQDSGLEKKLLAENETFHSSCLPWIQQSIQTKKRWKILQHSLPKNNLHLDDVHPILSWIELLEDWLPRCFSEVYRIVEQLGDSQPIQDQCNCCWRSNLLEWIPCLCKNMSAAQLLLQLHLEQESLIDQEGLLRKQTYVFLQEQVLRTPNPVSDHTPQIQQNRRKWSSIPSLLVDPQYIRR